MGTNDCTPRCSFLIYTPRIREGLGPRVEERIKCVNSQRSTLYSGYSRWKKEAAFKGKRSLVLIVDKSLIKHRAKRI